MKVACSVIKASRYLKHVSLHFRNNEGINIQSAANHINEWYNANKQTLDDLESVDIDLRNCRYSPSDKSRSILYQRRLKIVKEGDNQNLKEDIFNKLHEFRDLCLELKVSSVPLPEHQILPSFMINESFLIDFESR